VSAYIAAKQADTNIDACYVLDDGTVIVCEGFDVTDCPVIGVYTDEEQCWRAEKGDISWRMLPLYTFDLQTADEYQACLDALKFAVNWDDAHKILNTLGGHL